MQVLAAERVQRVEALLSIEAARDLPFQLRAPLAIASAFSPNPNRPPPYIDLPLAAEGNKHPEVIAKWTANALPVYDGDHTNMPGFRMQDHVLPFFGVTLPLEQQD